MTDHLKSAEKEIELARLLAERVGTRDKQAREQIRERISMARMELDLAESEIDTMEKLRGVNSTGDADE